MLNCNMMTRLEIKTLIFHMTDSSTMKTCQFVCNLSLCSFLFVCNFSLCALCIDVSLQVAENLLR